MQKPLGDAARNDSPEPVAVGGAEHDHVGALVLGELVQRPRGGDAADHSEAKIGVSPSWRDASVVSRSSASAIARS